MLRFNEMLQEALEPSFLSEAQLQEAQESLRATIDKHFISVVKINGKAVDSLVKSSPRKVLVTTDGKWTLTYIGHGDDNNRSNFKLSDSSSFYKNGKSKEYTFWGDAGTIAQFKEIVENAKNVEDIINGMYQASRDKAEFSYQELDLPNKDGRKLNPFSLTKGFKPYAKPLPKSEEEADKAKLRKDDLVKMIVSGQIERIEVAGHYTDDYATDADRNFSKGKQLDQIEFLQKYLGMDKPYLYFKEKGGKVIIHLSYASSYYVDLIPNESKFKK